MNQLYPEVEEVAFAVFLSGFKVEAMIIIVSATGWPLAQVKAHVDAWGNLYKRKTDGGMK